MQLRRLVLRGLVQQRQNCRNHMVSVSRGHPAAGVEMTDRGGAMTGISLQGTATTAKRVRGRPFAKGQSGNPSGRPRGSINRSTQVARLLLDGEATALSRKAVELALAGEPRAWRLCLDRSVELALPPTPDTAEDSKPTAELPLLLRPVAALQPRISAAERSRSLYFRCKKQRKQLVHRSPQLMQLDVPSALSWQRRLSGKLIYRAKEELGRGGACFETRPQFKPGAGSLGAPQHEVILCCH